jgi:hypothetical protein
MLKKSHNASIPPFAGLGKMNGLLRSGKHSPHKNKISTADSRFCL